MLSTPIFEQLCRELVDFGEPEEVCVEAAETGADNQKSTACPKPRSETDSEAEPESGTGSEAESDTEPESETEPEAESEPATDADSADESELEAGWTIPEERVA